MGTEGDQKYEYTAYNLDVIISVGYRVKSKRGTKFRQWANKVVERISFTWLRYQLTHCCT